MRESKTLEQLQNMIICGESVVLNLTASWCSDCTDQANNLDALYARLNSKDIACYSLVMQQERNIYLSEQHQIFTELVGGHGFPRTILVIDGQVADADNVEVISEEQLIELSEKFIKQL